MSVFDAATALQWSGGANAFRGGDYSRLYQDRIQPASHPDSEVRYAARTLRARARDLVRNNPYAAGVTEAFAANIVGEAGIRLRPRITRPFNDPRGEPAKELGWEIERAWADWSTEHASVDGFDAWHDIERLAAKCWACDGEVFIRERRGWDNPHGFAVELIDPDLLDESYNVPAQGGRNEIVMGVEVDAHGRRVVYHFWDRHPDEPGRKRVPIQADEITHHFIRYRPGQTRGYSLFAPVLTTVEMVDGYTEAELVASRMHASKMGFITNNDPIAVQAYAARMAMQNQNGKQDQLRRSKVAPGITEELLPGQGFVDFDPTHPNSSFDAFLKTLLRGVARGFGMSYLTLTGDVGEANYSSMRAGLLPERDQWRILQAVMARRVHRRVYRGWLAMALLKRSVRLPTFNPADYHAVEWHGRRWQWVDPANDLEAAEGEVKLGLNSRSRLAADRGLDYETVVDELAEEQDYARTEGVYVGGANAPKPAAPTGNGRANGNGTPSNRLAPFTPEHP